MASEMSTTAMHLKKPTMVVLRKLLYSGCLLDNLDYSFLCSRYLSFFSDCNLV